MLELMEKPFHSFLSPQGFRTLTRQTVPKSPAFTLYSPAKYHHDDHDDDIDDGDDDGDDGISVPLYDKDGDDDDVVDGDGVADDQ